MPAEKGLLLKSMYDMSGRYNLDYRVPPRQRSDSTTAPLDADRRLGGKRRVTGRAVRRGYSDQITRKEMSGA